MKKSRLNEIIKEEVAWFRNFNQASDNFMDLLDAVLKSNKSGFVKGLNKMLSDIFSGKKPSPDVFKSVVNEKLYKAYYEIGKKQGSIGYDYDTFVRLLVKKRAPQIFPKMLLNGVISDLKDGGSNISKYATGENKKFLDDMSVQRGKDKFTTMLKNKGLAEGTGISKDGFKYKSKAKNSYESGRENIWVSVIRGWYNNPHGLTPREAREELEDLGWSKSEIRKIET